MRKFTKVGLLASQLGGLLLVAATPLAAAVTISQPISGGDVTIAGVVNTIVQVVFGVGILVCIVFLVLYGIKYITAGDDVKKIEGARKGITGAIIGLAVIVLTFTLIKAVAAILGITTGNIFDILPSSLRLSQ
ncbi:hypothetical protein COS81_04715 [candidate division WWE3 bacterium CG06_land_8_20_14_3_00_42_16]|uniref:DUF4190 domain-containing protein n=2 Tax=Katanobacteria TaxID=422282 RepID=A0A2M7ALM6_UNCKA|nr:MAG: hypothetical protein COS81_04715 [candidate division WWE3 bacterium CG06_land_8_20_14_3_00_42_16]PIZ43095.1 MAG: hypothetical protein COY34_01525 [candidate division WWE3 bacterium CG_4_10_14_0_2_um_filter_42_8]